MSTAVLPSAGASLSTVDGVFLQLWPDAPVSRARSLR